MNNENQNVTTEKVDFGSKIKTIREEAGLTQKEFGEKTGFTSATVSAYENNKKAPVLDFLMAISEKFSVSMDWLCGLNESRSGDFNIENYSDLIECLSQISNVIDLQIEGVRLDFGMSLDFCDVNSITTRNDVLQMFLDEWAEMLSLKNKGTISDRLYKLWVEDKKKEYNIAFNENIERAFLKKKGYENGFVTYRNHEITDDIPF